MSNSRKKRNQRALDRRVVSSLLLAKTRRKFIWRIRWMNFVAWLKSLFGWR